MSHFKFYSADPIELNLKPGDYIIFWAKTAVHARTTLKKGEEVCIMSYGFPLKNLEGEFKHEVRQFQKPYDNQQAEQISLMV